jgi:hypothetical protein
VTAERVYVYYEDSRTRGGTFTLHDLVLASVGDRLGRSLWDLRKVVGCNVKRGNSNVLKACESDGRKLAHKHIAVLLDGDKLDRALPLRRNYCKPEARAAFGARVTDRRFELFVLDRNVETLIETLGGLRPDIPLLEEALRKDRNARDAVFSHAVWSAAARSQLRTDLCQSVKSFGRFVGRVAGWLESQDAKPG